MSDRFEQPLQSGKGTHPTDARAAVCPGSRLAVWPLGLTRLLSVAVWAIWAVSGQLAMGNNSDAFVTQGIRGADVLQVRTELEGGSSAANLVARISITNAARPSPADRNLVVVLYVTSWGTGLSEGISYTVPTLLPEGQTQVEVAIPIFQPGQQVAWDVAVFENGRDLEDLRQRPRNQVAFQWFYDQGGQASLAMIQATRESANQLSQQLQQLSIAYERETGLPLNSAPQGRATPGGATFGQIVPIQQVGQNWRCFLTHHQWILSADAFLELQESHPPAAEALRTFVAAGGKLVVHNCEGKLELGDIQRFLWRRADEGDQLGLWRTIKTPSEAWWRLETSDRVSANAPAASRITVDGLLADAAAFTETVLRPGVGQHLDNLSAIDAALAWRDDFYSANLESRFDAARRETMVQFDSEQFVSVPYLAGEVVYSERSLTDIASGLLVKGLGADSYESLSVKTSYDADGNWFWCNLIEAVGKPPVWTFAMIVALFGLLLGPGLLVLTGRLQRRSLMIFLVPCISVLATSAIIAYGVLHEGFDTYIKLTSVTRYDAGTDQVFVWSRQNYFSGLPPREGLRFDSQTYVRPVKVDEENTRGAYGPPRDQARTNVLLTDDQQWRGWLRARQQQQLLVGHPGRSAGPPVKVTRLAGNQIQVENQSRSELPFVLLRGAGADYYLTAEPLPAGASVALARLNEDEVKPEIARQMVDRKPLPPSEMSDGGQLLSFGRRWRTASSFSSSDMIQETYQRYFSDTLDMEPFTYATLTETNDLIQVPIEGQTSDGLHLVVGRQSW